jgi:glycosyltransferase involved in cell wall biosynthesis
MRILVASHTYIVDLNCEKLKALSELEPEIEVTVVVPRRWRPGGVQNKIIETQPYQDGSFRVAPITNFSENNQGLLTFGADIIPLLSQFSPHIIQVEQGAKALGYAQLITLNQLLGLNAKNLFFTWWNLPYTLKFPASWLEAYNLRHTDGVIAGNQDGAEILREHGYQKPIKVMPQLGVNEQRFHSRPQPELKQKLGIKSHEFVVGFVGRFVEEKGLLTLGQALSGLQNYPWKWLLVGRGILQPVLMEKAIEWGIQDRMIWVESVAHAEVPLYINVMNTLVLPSQTNIQFKTLTSVGWKEQFGHVIIEAMASQVPVIGSNCGEIPHVIEEAGLIFPQGNSAALKTCIEKLMTQPELANHLAQLGYERAMSRYTNQALARQVLDFYQELLTGD